MTTAVSTLPIQPKEAEVKAKVVFGLLGRSLTTEDWEGTPKPFELSHETIVRILHLPAEGGMIKLSFCAPTAEPESVEFASSELIPDIDFEAAEQQLRRAASELNVDLDALLSTTESLFGEGRIRPRKQPLEESELESLFEDDQNAR